MEEPFSSSSDYSIFLGAPTFGDVVRSLYPADGELTSDLATPVLWESVQSSITFASPPLASLPPSQPATALLPSLSQPASATSSSQRRSSRTSFTPMAALPPPPASARSRPNPTPSPPKASSKPTPTPSPHSHSHSSEAVGTFSFETSGPSSGRRGTRNRGPEWTPILTPPSQDSQHQTVTAGASGDLTGRSLVGKGARGLMSMVAEEDEVGAVRGVAGELEYSPVCPHSPTVLTTALS